MMHGVILSGGIFVDQHPTIPPPQISLFCRTPEKYLLFIKSQFHQGNLHRFLQGEVETLRREFPGKTISSFAGRIVFAQLATRFSGIRVKQCRHKEQHATKHSS